METNWLLKNKFIPNEQRKEELVLDLNSKNECTFKQINKKGERGERCGKKYSGD